MDENRLRFGVGVLVISSIGVGIILTFLFGAFPSVLTENYTLLVKFPSAQGIGLNTNVVRDGVRIGRVSDVQLRREGGVLVTLEMQETHRENLTHRYVPQIGAGNLVSGDAQIEFVAGTAEDLEKNWGTNLEILDEPYSAIEEAIDYGKVTPGFLEMQSELASTFETIRKASVAVAQAGGSVNGLVAQVQGSVDETDDKIAQVADEAVESLEAFQDLLTAVNDIVGDPDLRKNLDASFRELPTLLQNAQKTFDSAQKTFESFERVGDSAAKTVQSFERTAGNIEQFTRPLGEQGDALVTQFRTTFESLERALDQVDTFGQALNNENGTIRRLMEDEELYYQIRRTITNIEEATARVRPILDDVRVFSDKIARDPRQLGVKGALNNRPNGAGYK